MIHVLLSFCDEIHPVLEMALPEAVHVFPPRDSYSMY